MGIFLSLLKTSKIFINSKNVFLKYTYLKKVPFIFGIFQNPSSCLYKSPIDINIPNVIKIEKVFLAVARETDIQTYMHFVKTTFLDSGDLKADNHIEISNSTFYDHNTFSI